MFPVDFVKRTEAQKYIDTGALLKALDEPSPVSIRINKAKWGKTPAGAVKVPWSSNGYYLESRPSFTLDPLFHSGCYYPQEASGMFLEQVLKQTVDQNKNLKILDLCGAPGGKSLIINDIIGRDNLLISNETIRARASVLSETLTKWGANVIVTQSDPSAFGKLSGYFDVILVDAPCSGEGMFRTEVARNEWSVSNSALCSERQKRILSDVWPSLKENGILIYSTCTFNPGENEENLKWLADEKEAECIRIDISEYNGITAIEYDGVQGYGFYPDKVKGEGFFISVVRKSGFRNQHPTKIRRRDEFIPSRKEIETILKWIDTSVERVVRFGDDLVAIPCNIQDLSLIYDNIKIVKPGIRLAALKGKNFIPSHELAMARNIKAGAFNSTDLSLLDSLAFLKRNNFRIDQAGKGWKLLTYKGINIGFINNIGYRFNNYYPVDWRIKMDIPENTDNLIINWNYE